MTTAWGHDVDLAQAVTTYFDAIGVDVEVNELPDGTTMQDRLNAGSHGGITAGCCRHAPYDAYASMRYRFYGDPGLYHGATDETFNALMDQIAAVTDNETMARAGARGGPALHQRDVVGVVAAQSHRHNAPAVAEGLHRPARRGDGGRPCTCCRTCGSTRN